MFARQSTVQRQSQAIRPIVPHDVPKEFKTYGPYDVPHVISLRAGAQTMMLPETDMAHTDVAAYARVYGGSRMAYDTNQIIAKVVISSQAEQGEFSHTVLTCGNYNDKCSSTQASYITLTVPTLPYRLTITLPDKKLKTLINRAFLYVEQPSMKAIQTHGQQAFTALKDSMIPEETFSGRLWQNFKSNIRSSLYTPSANPFMFALYGNRDNDGGQAVFFAEKPIRSEFIPDGTSQEYHVTQFVVSNCSLQSFKDDGIIVKGPGVVFRC